MGNILNRKKAAVNEEIFYRPYKPKYIIQPVVKYNGCKMKVKHSYIYNGVKGGFFI